MKLRRIKLAGFKSFADPVTLAVSSRMAGIVGPNGAGKSNLIDAVRWVSGESSARNLRGATLDDVIFNGSASRSPAGRASVELVFDNVGGRAPGVWSKYAEISVRRSLSRDGLSEYFINGTRVNRRDITQMFLGTGFGARSYSIIEQGMISRIVEARPEELGGFIEEASGISRFREKRKETLSKLRSTSDNLDRLDIMRGEVQKRLNQLKSQSKQAMRFRNLKDKERKLRIELLAHEHGVHEQQICERSGEQSRQETVREQRLADLRATESELEQARRQQLDLQTMLSELEIERYRTDARIAAIERNIEDAQKSRTEDGQAVAEAESDIARITGGLRSCERDRQQASDKLHGCSQMLDSVTDDQRKMQLNMEDAEKSFADIADQTARCERELTETRLRCDAAKEKLARTLRDHDRNEDAIGKLKAQQSELDPDAESETGRHLQSKIEQIGHTCQALEFRIEESDAGLDNARKNREHLLDELDELRQSAQEANVRLISLQRSHDAADSERRRRISAWLASRGLDSVPELSSMVEVFGGWERAVDRVLGSKLSAIPVDDLGSIELDDTQSLSADLYLVDSRPVSGKLNGKLPALAQHVSCPDGALDSWLTGVYAAESICDAMDCRSQLDAGECIVTADGALVGPNWLSPALVMDEPAGVVELSSTIRQTRALVEQHERNQALKRTEIEHARAVVDDLEKCCQQLRSQLTEHSNQRLDIQMKLNDVELRQSASAQRASQLREQIAQISRDNVQLNDLSAQIQAQVAQFDDRTQELSRELVRLQAQRHSAETAVGQARSELDAVVERKHQCELNAMRWKSEREAADTAIQDLKDRIARRKAELAEARSRLNQDDPTPALKKTLDQLTDSSRSMSEKLAQARSNVDDAESSYRQIDQRRLQHQLNVEQANSLLNDKQLEINRLSVQLEGIVAKMKSLEIDPGQCAELLSEDFDPDETVALLEKAVRRIDNFGPINLTAIDEFEQERVRKEYMDSQYADLADAVATLEGSVAKIDRETRQRFQKTYESVNHSFQEIFPKLFGGGKGYLELSGEYPTDAGISVFACPKGKRINNIQSLSGGEKALTAVALLLSIYQLNPAPVCFLDEIDAPLDDENVFRLCQNLRYLSERTQLFVVTHNKITMENADMLFGVAMPEPNVSQLLSVNLEQAQEYAA